MQHKVPSLVPENARARVRACISHIIMVVGVVAILLGCIGVPLAHAKATSEGESGVGGEPLPLSEHSIGEIVILWLGLVVRARVG